LFSPAGLTWLNELELDEQARLLVQMGHFFRRLAEKKNRNVAVVAAARKLAMIGWHMLTTGEPTAMPSRKGSSRVRQVRAFSSSDVNPSEGEK
jgi:hypothetical protein